jgi:hypothetical protein
MWYRTIGRSESSESIRRDTRYFLGFLMFIKTYMSIAMKARRYIIGSMYSKIMFLLFNAKYVDAAIIERRIVCVSICAEVYFWM